MRMDLSSIKRELRRNQSTLAAVGLGVIAFGVWSVIKVVLMMTLNADGFFETLGLDELAAEGRGSRILGFAVVGVLLAFDLLLRLFIGLRARREGLARKKAGVIYLVLACLLAVASVYSDVTELIETFSAGEAMGAAIKTYASRLTATSGGDIDNAVVALLVELTSLITLFELIVAGIRVKRLEKLAAAQEV